jgi:hypothetical protein
MPRKRKPAAPEVVGFLGVGLDGDGHRRVTEADHFILLGGSAETHERMQEAAVKFGEALDKKGKQIAEVTPQEAIDLLRDAHRTG